MLHSPYTEALNIANIRLENAKKAYKRAFHGTEGAAQAFSLRTAAAKKAAQAAIKAAQEAAAAAEKEKTEEAKAKADQAAAAAKEAKKILAELMKIEAAATQEAVDKLEIALTVLTEAEEAANKAQQDLDAQDTIKKDLTIDPETDWEAAPPQLIQTADNTENTAPVVENVTCHNDTEYPNLLFTGALPPLTGSSS